MNVSENDLLINENQPIVYILHVIVYSVIFLVGLVGNILVIYAILYFSRMQTVTNIYILNLAIADVCYLLGAPFLIVTIISNHWIFGPSVCKIYMASTSINQFTTSIFMLVISADRYIAVCHPNHSSKLRTSRLSKIISLIGWIVSILSMIPIFVHASEIQRRNNKKSCVINWWDYFELPNVTFIEKFNDTAMGDAAFYTIPINDSVLNSYYNEKIEFAENLGFAFNTYTFALSFAVPLSLIAIFYGLILSNMVSLTSSDKTKEMKSSRRRVTKMVLIVIAVYVVCWLPHWIMQWLIVTREITFSKLTVTINIFISCLSYSNSAINPILYGFLSKNFRKSFLKAYSKAERPLVHRKQSRMNEIENTADKFEIHAAKPNRNTEQLAALVSSKTVDTSFSDSQESLTWDTNVKRGNNTSMETTSL